MNYGVLLIGIAILLMAVAIVLTLLATSHRAAFDQTCIHTDAEITNLRIQKVRGTFSSSTEYYVDYTYFSVLPELETVRQGGHHQISEAMYNNLKVGGSIDAVYLPDHPEISRPAKRYLDRDIERSNSLGVLTYAGTAAVVLVILGIIIPSSQDNGISSPTTTTVLTEQQIDLQEIHTALDSQIPRWQTSGAKQPVRLSPVDAGFSSSTTMREVYYGFCTVNGAPHFYIYVVHIIIPSQQSTPTWLGEAYTYTPGIKKVTDCLLEGWSAISDTPIQDNWHVAYIIYPAQTPFYKLTAQSKGGQ